MKELFESLESLAIGGNWNGFERIQITVLKLTGLLASEIPL